MTSFEAPETTRHFQAICDACQELINKFHTQAELRLYADGYLHALRKTALLPPRDQEKLEKLIDRWILDPSSFIGPDGDLTSLFHQKNN